MSCQRLPPHWEHAGSVGRPVACRRASLLLTSNSREAAFGMTIPLLSNVFSTPGHVLEERQVSLVCPRCHDTCSLEEVHSVASAVTRTYHCLRCKAVVATVSDPAQVAANADAYLVAGWAVCPLGVLSIALEVSAITIPPQRDRASYRQSSNDRTPTLLDRPLQTPFNRSRVAA